MFLIMCDYFFKSDYAKSFIKFDINLIYLHFWRSYNFPTIWCGGDYFGMCRPSILKHDYFDTAASWIYTDSGRIWLTEEHIFKIKLLINQQKWHFYWFQLINMSTICSDALPRVLIPFDDPFFVLRHLQQQHITTTTMMTSRRPIAASSSWTSSVSINANTWTSPNIWLKLPTVNWKRSSTIQSIINL